MTVDRKVFRLVEFCWTRGIVVFVSDVERRVPLESSEGLDDVLLDVVITGIDFRDPGGSMVLLLAIGYGLVDINSDVKAASEVLDAFFVR